jgi:hypothetical protein
VVRTASNSDTPDRVGGIPRSGVSVDSYKRGRTPNRSSNASRCDLINGNFIAANSSAPSTQFAIISVEISTDKKAIAQSATSCRLRAK